MNALHHRIRELAQRASSGTLVRLLWRQGTTVVWVEVSSPGIDRALAIEEPAVPAAGRGEDRPRLVLEHPPGEVAPGRAMDRDVREGGHTAVGLEARQPFPRGPVSPHRAAPRATTGRTTGRRESRHD